MILDDISDNKSLTEDTGDEIEGVFLGIKKELHAQYIPFRENDKHIVATGGIKAQANFALETAHNQAQVSGMVNQLEQCLRALTCDRKQAYQKTGQIDQARLVQIAKNLSKNVYFTNNPGEKIDTCVMLALDQSGSMRSGRTDKQIRNLTILIAECLNRLNIPFCIFGSTTDSYAHRKTPYIPGFTRVEPVIFYHYKDFGDNWPAIRHRLMQYEGIDNNNDGEWVEYAYKLAKTCKQKRKIIFSLSDGLPAGQDGISLLCNHLSNVVKYVRKEGPKNGIELYGVGIGTNDPEQYYGKEYYIKLLNLDKLGQEFVKAFGDILTKNRFK